MLSSQGYRKHLKLDEYLDIKAFVLNFLQQVPFL